MCLRLWEGEGTAPLTERCCLLQHCKNWRICDDETLVMMLFESVLAV